MILIGDSLGRVIAEIVRHVRGYYSTSAVPACDRRDKHEKRPLPRAPYLLQGRTHPSTVNSEHEHGPRAAPRAVAGRGRPPRRRHPAGADPHDCRRVFAFEHLNSQSGPRRACSGPLP